MRGAIPPPAQKAAKTARTDTMAALAVDYLNDHARPNKRTAAEDERILDVEVLPFSGDRSVRDLTRADIKALLKRVVGRGSPIMANRVLALVRKVLNYAVDEEWIDANPAARLKKPAPEPSRDRVLTDDELRRIWRLLSHLPNTADKPAPGRRRNPGPEDDPLCPVSAHLAALLKVRLLTAQRGGEVARMRWSDLDLTDSGGWWTIPGSDTKNGEPHRVWLVRDAVDIIKALQPPEDEPREYVFALRGASITHRAKKAPVEITRVLQIDFKGHDFRRTASTKMAEAGTSREHIAFVLNRVQGGARATQVYDRYNRDREKQAALETWARTLTAILKEKESGKVVAFGKHG